MTDETKSGVSPMLLGGGFAALIVVLAVIFLPTPDASETVESPPAQPATQAAEPEVANDAPAVTEGETQPVEPETQSAALDEEAATQDAQDAPAPDVVAEAPEPPQPQGPEFDTFRVETDGSMVIAGRAEPGQVVDVILAGEAIERVTADANGAFVALPLAGPSDQPRRLSLVADPDGAAIESLTSYIVAPIAPPVVVAEVAPEPEPEPEAVSEPETVVAEAVEDLAEGVLAAESDTSEETAPALAETVTAELTESPDIATDPAPAPTVLQADADGVRIVQGEQAEDTDNVALDAITYDPEGDVQLSGRASSDDGAVQVYINNEPLAAAPITEEGDWRLDLPDIDTGVYTLRVDEVDEEGTVVSRVETPFKREEPGDVAAVLAEETAQEGFEVAVRTVQPGATLWAIAEETMGDGIMYVQVFEANRDLIRDPDLIFPGQIFRIPEVAE